ncbi:MAG TPA: hypothetical protein VGA70_02515 [Longimicrobiales bacterium]
MARCGVLLAALSFLIVPAIGAQDLTVQTNLPGDGFVQRDASVELTLSRPLDRTREAVAVFIGETDFTGLFRASGQTLAFSPQVATLPAGESDLVVYHVSEEGAWSEVARETFRVEGTFGFRRRDVSPKLDVGVKAQLDEGQKPDEGFEPNTFQNVDATLDLGVEQIHAAFTLGLDATVLGVNHQENALRFRDRGEEAPKADLSSYKATFRSDVVGIEVGHVRAGRNSYLMNGFSARGATLSLTPGSRVDAEVGVTNGSSVVGWDDLVGLDDGDHRLMSASVGLEALSTPGALRVELSYMDGSKLPRSGFNQGQISDAEKSSGLGVRVQGQGLGRRLRFEAGFAESTFDNPEDPTLEQGQDLVAVREESRQARFVNGDLDLLKNLSLGANRRARLSVGIRHERVDPLYRSVGASVGADQLQNQYDVRADIAGIAVQASLSDSEDNLDRIASILTSNTERRSLTVGVPLPTIFRGENSAWLPALQYRLNRNHQFGEALPENGGFSADHVPDQENTTHSASAGWRFSKVDLSYKVDLSEQDNRQTGREQADFKGRVDAIAVGLKPHGTLSLNVDVSWEEAESIEREEIDHSRRYGVRANWRPFQRSTLAVSYSDTFKEDDAETREQGNTSFDVRWSSAVPGASGVNGQYFIRYARNESTRVDRVRDVADDRERWSVNAGLSFSLGGR